MITDYVVYDNPFNSKGWNEILERYKKRKGTKREAEKKQKKKITLISNIYIPHEFRGSKAKKSWRGKGGGGAKVM